MNETEFLQRWQSEESIYEAWGDYVVQKICEILATKGKNMEEFFKVPPSSRTKEDDSLIDKAFYRNKAYDDPYAEIEDKVGARFVVLLIDDIQEVCGAIQGEAAWTAISCRDFALEKELEPLLFTYQSMHYVVRPNGAISHNGCEISGDIPCEIQVRTLLQHAHAELTHDTVYKAKTKVKPSVHRTVAKSMALIETTDDFFGKVTTALKSEALEKNNVISQLDDLYQRITGRKPKFLPSSLIIWDTYEASVDEHLVDRVTSFVDSEPTLGASIVNNDSGDILYKQSVILFVYWMLKRRRSELLNNWPLATSMLQTPANDIGVNINPT